MPSNYDEIKRNNIRKYGTESAVVGHLLADLLYSDPTHFLFELLQNAEDAGAEDVKFRLYADRLELEHDGRPFSPEDVIGICDLVGSAKKEDLTKIGKFGIGFKSVYSHTDTPMVHSYGQYNNQENFAIDLYVQPRAIPAIESKSGTLFVLPFDRKDKNDDVSYREIADRLQDLGLRTLVFLNHVKSISYEIEDGATGTYLKDSSALESEFAQQVHMIGEKDYRDDEEEGWLLFQADVTDVVLPLSDSGRFMVQIAFLLSDTNEDSMPDVDPLQQSPVIAFFPTKMESNLGFLVQGPFRTTASRDSVPETDKFNLRIAERVGQLVVESLKWLRDSERLTVNVLNTMPLRSREYENRLLESVSLQVASAISTGSFIPTHNSGYVSAEHAKLARNSDLRELLSESQLQRLFLSDSPVRWVSGEIGEFRNQTRDLHSYLRSELDPGVEEIRPGDFVGRISEEFISAESDEWLLRLYEFAVDNNSELLKYHAKRKPILRLQDGSHVIPIQISNDRQVYLPSRHESQFNTIKGETCSSDKSVKFLRSMGIREPDAADEVVNFILPKYAKGSETEHEDNRQDVLDIVKALDKTPSVRVTFLVSKLNSTPFLLGTNSNGKSKYCCPDDLYYHTPELEIYFAGNPDAWFLDSIYNELLDDFQQLSIARTVKLEFENPDESGHVTLRFPLRGSEYNPHRRGLQGFDPECTIDGLELALSNPTVERSQFIWEKLMLPYKYLIRGWVQSSVRQEYPAEYTSRQIQNSKMGEMAKRYAWLPNAQGEFVAPDKITLEDLPAEFVRDGQLATALGLMISIDDKVEELLDEATDVTVRELLGRILKSILELARKYPKKLIGLDRAIKDHLRDN